MGTHLVGLRRPPRAFPAHLGPLDYRYVIHRNRLSARCSAFSRHVAAERLSKGYRPATPGASASGMIIQARHKGAVCAVLTSALCGTLSLDRLQALTTDGQAPQAPRLGTNQGKRPILTSVSLRAGSRSPYF